MSAGRVAATLVTVVISCATAANAQGLGAAAARAAEARKTPGTQPTVTLTDADLPKASVLEAELSKFTINTHVLHRYASARGCIASVRSLTPAVDDALLVAEKAEKDQLAIGRSLVTHPQTEREVPARARRHRQLLLPRVDDEGKRIGRAAQAPPVMLAVLLSSLLADAPPPQTLAEAAAKAREDGELAKKASAPSKTSSAPTIVMREAPPSRESGPPRLNEKVLETYLDARVALADMRRADTALSNRFHAERNKTKHYDELERVYGSEPAIVDLFATYGLSAYSYVEIERALYRGLSWAVEYKMSLELLSRLDRDNVKWVAAHRSFSESIRTRYKAAEQGLPFQGFIQQVF